MNEDELGMNLFLGDDFYEDEDQNNNQPDPNDYELKNTDLDDDNDNQDDEQNNDDNNDEGVNPEGVVGNTEDDDANHNDDVDNSSPPLYKSLASMLMEKGVLTSVDSSKLDDVKDEQGIADLIIAEVKAKELADLSDLQKEAVEAFRAGVNVETFKQQKQTEQELDSITEDVIQENQQLRFDLIYQDFINKGYTEEKATKFTNRSIEADDDIEDAKEALENIKQGVKERFNEQVEFEKNEKAKLVKQKADDLKALEKRILESEEPIPGLKLNDVHRKEVLKSMMTPVSKNPVTGVEENALMKEQRENKEFSQKLYTVFTLSKGFTDFSMFAKQETKKMSTDFDKILKNNKHVLAGGNESFLDDPNSSDFEIGDKLVY